MPSQTHNQKPFVSVVIPAYQAEAFLGRTLASVARQTYRDFEVIVVDDGSRDQTARVAEEFLVKENIQGRCIRQENRKIAGARNTGIRSAQGEFIALLDHDDLWMPEKLERVMEAFSRWPETDLICHNEQILKDGKVVRISQNHLGGGKAYEELLFRGSTLSPSAVVFRKALFEQTGGFDESPELNTVEDYDFWLRASRIGRIRYLNATLGAYVLVNSAASNRVLYHYQNLEAMLKRHLKKYCEGECGWTGKIWARRRLASVYRAALAGLRRQGIDPFAQQRLSKKMIQTCYWDPKNILKYLEWRLSPTHEN